MNEQTTEREAQDLGGMIDQLYARQRRADQAMREAIAGLRPMAGSFYRSGLLRMAINTLEELRKAEANEPSDPR